MPWIRIDEEFGQHPKVLAAGPLGMAMQVAALCYCNRNLTDGYIPRAAARTLLDWEIATEDGTFWRLHMVSDSAETGVDCMVVIDRLVMAGLWHPADGGWIIHDYHDYQPSKADVEATREQRREAGRLGGLAKGKQDAKQDAKQNPSKPPSKTVARTRIRNRNRLLIPSSVPKDEEIDLSSDSFDRFWKAYPRHEAKQTARKAWDKRITAGTDPETMIAAAAAYGEWGQRNLDDTKYFKHPATWLNSGCETDELRDFTANASNGESKIRAAARRHLELYGPDGKGPVDGIRAGIADHPQLGRALEPGIDP